MIFDKFWGSSTSIPIVNLNEIYSPPIQYENLTGIKLKMTAKDLIAIEGNKKFRILDGSKSFDYYDTVKVYYPDTEFERTNVIFLLFEEKTTPDSIYIVMAKSENKDIYYKQIFYSSIIVKDLNDFSNDPEQFRIDPDNLVSQNLLNDNDSLIQMVFDYFNNNIESLGIAECGTNCNIFQKICNNFGVPCRIINLQGGDNDEVGNYDNIGYPLHVICEIYSSKHKKWYAVDPSFGFRFKEKSFNYYLNAVEISNKHTFHTEEEIIQDSILLTKRSLVGKDYFKYYENVVFSKPEWKNRFLKKAVKIFYGNFNYYLYLFSNNFPAVKNGFYYVGIKSFMYFFIFILYINSVLFLLMQRLFLVKKPKH
ncbi:MAG: hypothetical protein UZ05_CHB002002982 [Chlorobi bacterium OLB5]|nr:MAG: hypothetical protein UZ05_CHB002002982 [Chlorobi bacterium OLB5]